MAPYLFSLQTLDAVRTEVSSVRAEVAEVKADAEKNIEGIKEEVAKEVKKQVKIIGEKSRVDHSFQC